MMDATYTSVIRLHEQGITPKQIAKRLHLSEQKVRRILITVGAYSTPTSEEVNQRIAQGETLDQIAEALGISRKSVIAYTPYSKCMYGQEYPTKNALKIRRSRAKAKSQGAQK